MTISKREHGGSTYHLRKRVPARFKNIEHRRHIGISLHTDSWDQAQQKASVAWRQLLAGWEARLAGDTSDAEKRFAAARQLAQARNYRFLPSDQVAALTTIDLSERINIASVTNGNHIDKIEAAAVLGGAIQP